MCTVWFLQQILDVLSFFLSVSNLLLVGPRKKITCIFVHVNILHSTTLMLNYDRTVILVSSWLIKAFIWKFYLRKFSDMLRFCVTLLNVMLCHFIPKGSSTNTYHKHSFTLLWVQRVSVCVEVGARFMLRLWLGSRLTLAFRLHTVVPSESQTYGSC